MAIRATGRLRTLWWRLRGSLWFVPSILVTLATLAAFLLVQLEGAYGLQLQERWPRLFGVGAEGARSLLSAIATTMLTVAGTMFSVTLAVLSLAASQYSPRVLRSFISDRPTQFVLGFFVAVFAYCLIALRTIRSGDDGFVPSLAVLGAIILAFVTVGLLVFFIHHLASSIEASTILERVTRGTSEAIDGLFPEDLGDAAGGSGEDAQAAGEGEWACIPALASGYIVSIDEPGLLDFARRQGRAVRMDLAIGDFAVAGQPLASLQGAERADPEATRGLNACYSLERQRTIEQDAAFGLQQIVDIGLKALSPGINDQSTAILCIDRLSELMVRLARRRIAARCRRDGTMLRVIAQGPTFAALLELALRDLCESASGKPAVLRRLLDALERIGKETANSCRRGALALQARRVSDCAARSIADPRDREALLAQAGALERRLRNGAGSRCAA